MITDNIKIKIVQIKIKIELKIKIKIGDWGEKTVMITDKEEGYHGGEDKDKDQYKDKDR